MKNVKDISKLPLVPDEKTARRRTPISQASYVPAQGDTIPTETLVVQYGYVPLKAQIERMIQAGKELDAFRKEYYDFGDEREIPSEYEDPTRAPGFDMSEAYAYMRVLAKRIKEREKQIAEGRKKLEEKIEPAPKPVDKT
jgi:hypothetical protein